LASFLLQLTFQTFTTWYALYAMDRFSVGAEDASIGFVAWALGGVLGALPAGFIGLRLGRRNTMMLGFALMTASLMLLDRVAAGVLAVPLIALASAIWTLPTANAYPLFVEPIPRQHRGMLTALFLLSMALGGAIGDPLNGSLFDYFGSYRSLFLTMAGYTALAFVAVLFIPRRVGEAGRPTDAYEPGAISDLAPSQLRT
jgi:MFS family permease